MDAPNAVWTVDFKGRFRLGDGQLCYPLTLADGYSRFLLRCDRLTSTAGFAGRATYVLDCSGPPLPGLLIDRYLTLQP